MLKKFDYEKMPVVDIVNEILVDSSKRGASDIHFDPHEKFMKIRIRIDGELTDYTEVPNDIKKNLVTRIKILAEMNITESRLPQDGAIKGKIDDVNLDLRVSALPTNMGEKIVVRILDYSMSVTGIDKLGFSQRNLEKVLHMISVPNGIILVTGATGTGKSTTVYSILQRLNKENTNIITVEDPIEMDIEGVNQVQTNSEIGLTFATALRSILRQDPNIIMIGEIRDTETARIAVRASITGHLVLSTIHTNNSLNTIERLLDMDVERYLLSSALTGIISQKLARRLCPHCRKLRQVNDYEKKLFKNVLGKDVDEIYTSEGCEECGNGFKGRLAIHEVLLINQEIKDAISNNVRKEDLRKLVYKSDVTTLLQDGLEKVLQGDTTFEEVLKLIELDDEDLHSGHGLEKAIDDTNLSKTSKDEPDEETKEATINIEKNQSNPSELLKKATKNTFQEDDDIEKEMTPKVIEKKELTEQNIQGSNKTDNDFIKNSQLLSKKLIAEENMFNINAKNDEQKFPKEEINRKNTSEESSLKSENNLESFLAEAQQLFNQKKITKEKNNEIEPIKTDKEKVAAIEPKTNKIDDDYGLNDTINFINEYKKGLKKYNQDSE